METMWDYLKDERVLAGMAIVVVGLFVKMLTRKKPKLPPGPTVWPVVGSLPSLKNDIEVFNEFSDKYGDIYFIQLGLFGHNPTVVLSNMTLVREAYLQKQDDFAGRYRSPITNVLFANGQDLIFGDFTPEWRYLRKIGHTALRKYTSGPRFQELLERNVEIICEIFQKGRDKPQDVFSVASLMFYNIIASLCFGKKYELNDPEFKFVKNMMDEGGNMFNGFFLSDLWPAMRFIPTPSVMKMKKIAKELHAFFDNIISEHKKNFDENDIRDLADFIIHSDMEMKGTGLEQYQVKLNDVFYRQILFDMFIGGTDTSRNTLTWAILLMANHPEVQRKAQKEIDDCIGREGKINNQNRAKLPYCEAVLYETLRMRHPAPLGLPHATTCDTTVGGYDLPKGTHVLVSTMRINQDPREWKNPEEFRPERFLDEHGNLAPKPNGFLPFSTGRRSCIGEAFAKSELHIILGNLLQRFSFLPPEGKKIDLTPKPSLLICIPDATKVIFKER